jgi:hypothetical protein
MRLILLLKKLFKNLVDIIVLNFSGCIYPGQCWIPRNLSNAMT